MRLLLIEDEIELASATRRALTKHGVVTDLATLIEDAWVMARDGHYDAIVVVECSPFHRTGRL